MTLEQIKNELQMDKNLTVIDIENCGDCFRYENVAIINYNGNGYRIIWDDKNALIQLCDYGYVMDGKTYFDGANDYVGNHFHLDFETIVDIVKSQIEYCEYKYGKFTIYDD